MFAEGGAADGVRSNEGTIMFNFQEAIGRPNRERPYTYRSMP